MIGKNNIKEDKYVITFTNITVYNGKKAHIHTVTKTIIK